MSTMVLETAVCVYAAVVGVGGVRWALRIRRGEGRLPSDLLGPSAPFNRNFGNPDRYLLPACGLHVGMAMILLWQIFDGLALHSRLWLALVGVVGLVILLTSMVLGLGVLLLNRPRFLLPPSVRDLPGLLARAVGKGRDDHRPGRRPAAPRRR
jgi:hypothetical protein